MTTRESNSTSSDNSGARHDAVASTVLDYVRARNGANLTRIASRAGLPEARTKTVLEALEAQDLIDVTPRLHHVRVTPTDADDDYQPVRTDGGQQQGPLHRLVDALTVDTPTLSLTEDDLYDVLSSQRRRSLIRLLAAATDGGDTEGAYLGLSPAARLLADSEADGQPTADDFHRCYVAITQTHAPVLEKHGIVDYYDRVQKLGATEQTVVLEQLLAQNTTALDGNGGQR